MTKQILRSDSTCGAAWLIKAVAQLRQQRNAATVEGLRSIMNDTLHAYRYMDAKKDKKPADLVESVIGFVIDALVKQTSTHYQEGRMTGESYIAFINELCEVVNLYDVIYLRHSHYERSLPTISLAGACSARIHTFFFTYRDTNTTLFLAGMQECIAILEAIIRFCGKIGDPQSAYYSLQSIFRYLTDPSDSPTQAMLSLGAQLANSDTRYRAWEAEYRDFDFTLFEKRAKYWKKQLSRWCALHIERNQLTKLLHNLRISSSPELQQVLNRRIREFTSIIEIEDPAGFGDSRTLLARIDAVTHENSDWCVQFTQTSSAIADQDEIIDANKWFFGESRRHRLAAQQTKDELLASLKHI